MIRVVQILVASFVIFSMLTGCSKGSDSSQGGASTVNENSNAENTTIEASRVSLTVVNALRARKLNSTDTTRALAVDGRIVRRDHAESLLNQGAVACALTSRRFNFQPGDQFVATGIDAGMTQGSYDTHQIVITYNQRRNRGFAIYCAKLHAPVSIGEVRQALRGIIQLDF